MHYKLVKRYIIIIQLFYDFRFISEEACKKGYDVLHPKQYFKFQANKFDQMLRTIFPLKFETNDNNISQISSFCATFSSLSENL